MYSGGADSTAALIAIDKFFDSSDIKIKSFEYGSKSNSSKKASVLANLLGYKTQITNLSFSVNDIEKKMKLDFVNPFNPHHSFIKEKYNENGIIISGQNMDALASINMKTMQHSSYTYLINQKWGGIKQFAINFIKNLQYIDKYIDNSYLFLFFYLINLYSFLFQKNIFYKSGFNNYLKGFYIRGFPNFIKINDSIFIETINNEIDKYLDLLKNDYRSKNLIIKILNYYHYSSNASKMLTSFPINKSQMYQFPMSGPILSYFLNRQLDIKDTLRPKKEIYNYIHDNLEISYFEILRENISKEMMSKDDNFSLIIEKFKQKIIKPNKDKFYNEAKIFNYVEDDNNYLFEQYDYIYEKIIQNKHFTKKDISLAFKILNIEFLISEL
jgi:hypothetical protein